MHAMDPAHRPRRTRPAGGCSAGTIPRTTGPRAGCPRTCSPPPTRCTGTSARPTRSSTARTGRRPPQARRAALDAWEDELQRGLAGGGSPHPVVVALMDAGERHDLPLGELGIYMRSMRADCGPVRIGERRRARRLHGRLGRLGRPDHGPAARRARALPRRLRAPRPGVPARRTSSATSSEDWEMDRIYLPGPRRRATSARPSTRRACAPPSRQVARARALFAAAEPAIAAAPASVRSGIRLACAAYAPHPRPRRGASAATCSAAASACAPATSWRSSWRARDDPPGDAARERAHAARRARRRADLRGELRRPRRRPRAGRQRRRRPRGRPLRDRRARHVGLRRADAVAARDGRRALDPPGARVHGVPHAARLGALPAPVELVELRLPRAVRGAVRAEPTPASRSPRSHGRDAARGVATRSRHGPRRPDRAADRRRARLAPRPRPRRQRPAARGDDLARPGGPSARRARHRPGHLDRPLGGPLRLRLVGARGGRAARRRRLLRAAPPRQGPHARDGARLGTDAGPLPGQLVPARAAPGGAGRRVLRRRLGRALHPAVGRGDSNRVLLRDRLRPRAARRPVRCPTARRGARGVRVRSRRRTPRCSAARWLCSA